MNKKLYDKLVSEEIKQTSIEEGSASPIGSASPRSAIPVPCFPLFCLS